MQRSGAYIKQPTGYRAFIPASLPPKPALRVEGELQNLLSRADMALARLDGLAEILPNVDIVELLKLKNIKLFLKFLYLKIKGKLYKI